LAREGVAMIPLGMDELVGLRGAAHGLSLRVRRPAQAMMLGGHRSAQRGRGLEFEEVRPYVAGDDPRSIDWRVTARRGKPHTKLYREERERPVWLLVDLHVGMFFGSRRQLKSMLAVRAAALLAWVAAIGGDRVGALILGEGAPRILPPRARDAGVLPILDALLEAQPVRPGVPSAERMDEAFRGIVPLMHPGSLILVLSDFARLGEQADAYWSSLVAHNECWMFWITDALEADGLPPGRYRAGLPGRLAVLDGARSRMSWQAAWQAREARLMTLANRFALPVTRLDTGEAVETRLPPLLRATRWAA
jgi:uncharacterized protein (DUF58 family)